MNRIFTLAILISGLTLASKTQSQTIYIDNGSSNTYTLQNGDSLYIAQGTFTGTINDWNNGGKVTIAASATFRPANVNNFRSKYTNYGTAIINSLGTENGFGLRNYGTFTINGGAQINGSAGQVITNYANGIINFQNSFAVNSAAIITNTGAINIAGNFEVWSAATVVNKKEIRVTGNFSSSNGQIRNEGLFSSNGTLTIGGSTAFTNTCRTIARNGLAVNNNNATVYNSGLLWAAGNSSTSYITNSGTIINTGDAMIKTVAFTSYNSVRGNGYLYILGASTMSGSVGTSGTTTDRLRIYTVNRSNPNQIFDNQWGTVHPSAAYATFSAPDTVSSANYPCSAEYAQQIILPVIWNSISASLVSDVPVINWSASFDEATKFEVERSENGVDFSKITTVASQQNVNNYKYSDLGLSANHATVVYYRINAVELDGTHKYSDVKAVRFSSSNAATSVQTWPNPFSTQLNISYKATQKTQLTISIYNVDGKLQVVKTVPVNGGKNNIIISEASKLSKGVYIVRVSSNNGDSSSSKIIKQ